MSLINKMLQDLEARRQSPDSTTHAPPLIYEDLRSPLPARQGGRPRAGFLMLLVLAAAAAGGYYAWDVWNGGLPFSGSRTTALQPITPVKVVPPVPYPAAVAGAPAPDNGAQTQAASVGTKPAGTEPAEVQPPVKPAPAPKADSAIEVKQSDAAKKDKTAARPVRAAVVAKSKPVPKEPPQAPATNAVTVADAEKAVMEKKPEPLTPEQEAESHYRDAAKLVERGRGTEAVSHLRMALSANPAHVKARELLAGLLLQQGHNEEARQTLEEGIAKSPTYYPFAQLLARILVQQGNEPGALALLEGSRAAAASDADYVAFLAVLYQRTGKQAEAVKAFEQALALKPGEGRWWLGLGISLEAEKQQSAAAEAYEKAVASGTLDAKLLQYVRQQLAIVKR